MRSNSTLSSLSPVLATLENLEGRQLFAGVVSYYSYTQDSLLYVNINGSSGGDNIQVDVAPGTTVDGNVTLKVGTKSKTWRGVHGVTVYGSGGNDKIKITGADLSDYTKTIVAVYGGKGNDTLTSGASDGMIILSGEEGNDLLNVSKAFAEDDMHGEYSFRSLYGGAGRDTLIGSADSDNLNGGDGDDMIWGNAGDDQIDGGLGYNYLNGGDGDDAFYVNPLNGVLAGGYLDFRTNLWVDIFNYGGHDSIDGGDGDDQVCLAYNSTEIGKVPTYGTTSINVELITSIDYGGGKG